MAPLRLRSYPNLIVFLAVKVCAVFGLQILSVAVALQVYALTARPISLGYVGLAQFVPVLLFTLPAGATADKFSRKTVLSVVYLAFSLLGVLFWWNAGSSSPSLAVIYTGLVALGTARAFSLPAGQSLIPSLVPKEVFPRAVAWSSIMGEIGSIVGPAVGGLLYAYGGAKAAYATAAVCTFVAHVLTGRLERDVPAAPAKVESRIERLLGGIRFVQSKPIILGAISLDLVAVLLGGAVALLPVYAKTILGVGEEGYGFLKTSQAVGALFMGMWLAQNPIERRAGFWMLTSVAVFGAATIGFGVSTNYWASLLLLAVVGASDMVSVVLRHTFLQINTPEDMRGRVSAVNAVFVGSSNELGELESGALAEWVGPLRAVVYGGVGTILVTWLWAAMFPSLRRLDSPHETHHSTEPTTGKA